MSKKIIVRLDYIPWLLYFMLITGFDSLKFFSDKVGRLWNYSLILCLLVLFIIIILDKDFDYIGIIRLSFLFIPAMVTLISNGWSTQAFVQMIRCLMMAIGFELMVRIKGIEDSISIMLSLFEILLYVNFIFMILYPNGMFLFRNINNVESWQLVPRNYQHSSSTERMAWLLDHQGLLTIYVSPGCCLSMLWSQINKKSMFNLRVFLMFVISSIEVYVYSRSGNCIITFSLFLIGIIWGNLWLYFKGKLPSVKMIFTVGVFLFIGVVYFNIQERVSWLFTNVLQRDLSFTGRVVMWQNGILAIIKKPIFGWGYVDSSTGWNLFVRAGHTHNQFLHIAFQGGLVSLILFLIFLLSCVNKMKNIPEYYQRYLLPLWSSIIAVFTGMFGDRYIPYYSIAFISFLLADHSEEIVYAISTYFLMNEPFENSCLITND